jgi:integrase
MTASKQRKVADAFAAKALATPSTLKTTATRISNAFDLFDGRIRIYQTTHSGNVWQFQMYVQAEQRYVRKSLKTRDKGIAAERAETMFIEYSSKIIRDEKIFSITAKQLTEKFLEAETERYESNQIRLGRLNNLKTHTKHYVDFIGANTPIQNYAGKEFRHYRAFRQKQKPDITMNAVLNELMTIVKIYSFAKDEGHIGVAYKVDYGKINIPSGDAKRDGYTIEEYTRLINHSKNFSKRSKDSEDKYYRELIHLFILGMSHFGFRTGELLSLKWGDVDFLKEEKVQITIRPENTKVNKRRVIQGEQSKSVIFKRIKTISSYTDDDCFVFSMYSKNAQLTKTLLYDYFSELVKKVKIKYEDFDDTKTLYSLRHFFITIHLMAEQLSPYMLAKYTGTSLQQIQKTYDHILDLEVSKKMMAAKKFIFKNGELVLENDLLISGK